MLTRPGRMLTAALASTVAAVVAATVSVSPADAGQPAGTTEPAAPAEARPRTGGTTSSTTPAEATTPAPPALTLESRDVVEDLPGARPNILVLMTDDMRADDLRWMPNVRRLIGEQGVEFVNGFSPNPNCCPARASFLTGRYTHNHGVWTNGWPYGFAAFDDSSTLATDLASSGYQTAFVGKYLNGYGLHPAPGDEVEVTAAQMEDLSRGFSNRYVPPGWHDWRGAITGLLDDSELAGGVYSYFRTTLNDNGVLRANPGVYQTHLLADESADMLTELARSPRPFFLWTSFVAPHSGYPIEPDDPEPVVRANGTEANIPTVARPRSVAGMFDDEITEPAGGVLEKDMSDKPRFLRNRPPLNADEVEALTEVTRQRAESLHVVDQEIARLLGVLAATGELDDTVVVFTSDNGTMIGEHGTLQAKKLPYESALRIPMLVRGPGIPAGETRRDPFTFIDLAPTLLDVAGVRSRRLMDGVSLLDVVRRGDRGWRRAILTEAGPRVVDPDVPAQRAPYPPGPSPLRSTIGVRVPHHLYVEHATGERELYDMRTDPLQLRSISGRPSAQPTVRRLARVLDRLENCHGPACRAPLARPSH